MSKNQVIDYTNEVGKLTPIIKEQVELMKSFADSSKKAYASLPSDFQKQQREQLRLEQENEKLRQQSIKTQQQLEDLAKRQIQTAQANQRLQAQNRREAEAQERAKQREAKAIEQANKAQERQNKLATEASRPYVQLQARWREAQRTLADLVVSQGESAEATRKARQEFELLDKQIRAVDGITKNYSKNVGNYASAFNGIRGSLGQLTSAFGIVGGVTAGIAVLKDAFNIMREFDSQMINVQKTTGLTNEELIDLKDSVVELSKELGIVSSSKLGEYMAVAGQLGVKGTKSLLDFTSAMAQLETASTIAGEEGASEMARFLTIVDGGVSNVKSFGNEIVNLGNNFAATESEILSNATRIAQSTGVYNLGRQQVLAYATATKAVGVEAELVGSTMGRTLGIFEKAIRTGNNLESITKILGTTQAELSERFKTDASGVLQDYIKALNNTYKAGGSVNAQLEAIGVTAIRDQAVISTLATKGYDVLSEAMIKVTEAGNAMGDEFDNASKKINNRIEALKTTWGNFILNIDNGDGAISNFVIRSINSLDKLITQLDRLNTSWNKIWESARTEGETLGTRQAEKFLAVNKDAESRMNAIKKTNEEIKKIEAEIVDLRAKEKAITEGSFFNKLTSKGVAWYRKDIEEKENYLGQYKGYIKRLQDQNAQEALARSGVTNTSSTTTAITDTKTLTKEQQREADNAEKERLRLEEERLKASAELKRRELQSDIENEKERSLMLSQNKGQQLLIEMNYQSRLFEVAELNRQENLRQAGDAQHKQLLAWQTYWEDLEKLSKAYNKANTDYQKEVDKQLSDSAKKAMEEAKKDFEARQKIREEEAKRIKQLAEETKNYLSKFTDMGQFGFSSLNIFTEVDEQGNTMFENLLKGAKDWKEKSAVLIGAVGEIAKDVMNTINQASQMRFEAEMERLKIEYETQLMFAGDSVEAREHIEQQYNEKQKELKKKQAQRDKEFALMSAIISTAQAVAVALTAGPIIGQILAGIVGAMGAIQIATIASTPIPEFWTGTDNAPEGLAWTQERGAEVITDKKGNVKTWGHNKGATLTYLNKGDKVYKSHEDYFKEQQEGFDNELNSILASNRISPIVVNNGVTKEEMTEVMQNTLGKQPKYSTVVDEQGINTYWQTKDSRQKIKNRSARR